MPQTEYNYTLYKGFEGEIASGEGTLIRTAHNAGSTVLPFGRVVVQSTITTTNPDYPNGAVLPSAANGVVLGISVKTDLYEKQHDGTIGYGVDKPINILRRGVIWMVAETSIIAHQPVFFRHTMAGSPGTHDAIGRVRGAAVSGQTDSLLNAFAISGAAAGELIKIAINMV